MSRPSALPEWATDTNYPAGTDPWSSTLTRIEPTAGERAAGFVPSEALPSQYLNTLFGEAADWIAYLDGLIAATFGDGSDGAIAFDGTNTYASFASKSGSDYTLTRDVYASSMTFTASATLNTAGYRIYCRGTIDTTGTALSGGVIKNPGGNASGATAGTGGAAGSLGGGGAGGAGGTPGGSDGTDVTHSLGGAGGDGTLPPAGGDGGTVTAPTATGGKAWLFSPPTLGYVLGVTGGAAVLQWVTGGGGGGGGTSVFGSGAGGGGGGGVVAIAAHTINLKQAADIKANGGNAGTFSGDGTGGGGGGGGVIIAVYCACSHTLTAAVNCAGGTKTGGGVDGSNGTVHLLDLGASGGVATLNANKQQRGKEIIAAADTVTVTFASSFAYGTATGASGYRMKTLSVYCSDGGDPVGATVTAKTTTGFTVTFDRVFTGELDWETEGSL